jgi:hypothetical protein
MADWGRLALYCVVTASTSSALDGSRMRFGDAFRGISDRAAGVETPAERRSNDLSLLERGLTGQRHHVVLRTGAAADADGADHLAAGHQHVSTA